ncbi:hypothetical protein HRW20_31665, partial [Streptomyces lunaelactis]|nr:hypothetical protein [Streptomyces lunaelactis]
MAAGEPSALGDHPLGDHPLDVHALDVHAVGDPRPLREDASATTRKPPAPPPLAPYYTPATAPGYLPGILARHHLGADGTPLP